MKNFLKTLLAVLAGLFVFGIVSTILFFGIIGSITATSTPVVPTEGVLNMNLSTINFAEQSKELDFASLINGETRTTLGIYSAVKAINAAALDPGVKFIYLRPDGVSAGISQIEELRAALKNFRKSGKAIIAYTETISNGSYYLASVADKVYVSGSEGGMNMMMGLSSQMFFFKDLLDKLGVNVQLIRHGKYKSAGETFIKNQISPENREQNEAMISSLWSSISNSICEDRNISADKFNSLIDNLSLVSSKDFVDNGLADAALTRDEREEKICSLYMVGNINQVSFIPFEDYVLNVDSKINIRGRKVAVIYADGEIVENDADIENISGNRFAELIAEVRKDNSIEAVVLRVNSPGGSVLASDKIKAELDLLGYLKPVVASYGNYAASGGYWISANCKKIYSNATTLTGSIGVFSMIPDFSQTVKDLAHVNVVTINSNKHSDMYSGMKELDRAELAYMQESVEIIYDRFTDIVSSGRSLDKNYVDEIAQGRVWSGTNGKEIGLVDEIGTLEDALRYTCNEIGISLEEAQVVAYPKQATTMETLMNSLQASKKPVIFEGTPFEKIELAFKDINIEKGGKVYARLPYDYVIE